MNAQVMRDQQAVEGKRWQCEWLRNVKMLYLLLRKTGNPHRT